MTHPMPIPRLQRRPFHHPPGPACDSCTHHTCRTLRALKLPIIGGHRTEFEKEHRQAAALQALNPHLLVWWGEHSQSYWVATSEGLTEATNPGHLLSLLDPCPTH
ncbi:hypothetical protein GCM10009603_40940 [Nocardiopsis exhalans]